MIRRRGTVVYSYTAMKQSWYFPPQRMIGSRELSADQNATSSGGTGVKHAVSRGLDIYLIHECISSWI
jgi:hypothetical protein